MTNLTEYGKGRSPSEIQYEPGAELVEELERKIAKLKDLLKECRDEIEYLRKHYKGNIDHFKNNTRLDKEINQVLGE